MRRASTTRLISKLEEVWDEFHRHNRTPFATTVREAPSFIDYAWQKFDTKTVIEVLLDDHATYRAQKPILFSGLCAWVISSHDLSLCRNAMLLVAIEHIKRAEKLGRTAYKEYDAPNGKILGDIFGRLRWLGDGFYEDFYYPIGGLATIVDCFSVDGFRKCSERRATDLKISIAIMQIFDHHAKHLNNSELYYAASESKAYELIRLIHGQRNSDFGIGIEKFERIWKQSRGAAALIYAASTIMTGEGESLLDKICKGSVSYENEGDYLINWVRRARYASNTILNKTTVRDIVSINAASSPGSLADAMAEATPDPTFSDAEVQIIESEFNMKKILGARQRDQRRTRFTRRGPRKG